MVNRTARRSSGIALLLILAGIGAGSAVANGSFPSGRTLESANGPLPGCNRAPAMTYSAENRRLSLRVCCNQISAPAILDGDLIRVTGPAISTRMHCGDGQATEDRFVKQIDSQRQLRWRLEGGMLILESDPPLRFRIPAS